jgi:hypothetical protein
MTAPVPPISRMMGRKRSIPEGPMIPALSGAGADIAEICLRFHVRRLDLFGSAARETDFTDQSDICLLVEYEPG